MSKKAPVQEHPHQGGSFVRQPDGSLKRVAEKPASETGDAPTDKE